MAAEQSDIELIKGYLSGDVECFGTLYERYRRPIYSYLNKMLPGQSATVDDLYQRTWLKATHHLGRYKEKNFLSWLIRIAHNTAIDHIRQERQREYVEIDESKLDGQGLPPWKQMSNSELGQAIEDAVDQLPPDLREVFILRQQKVSFKEIAELQACSINTALGRMRYAMLTLRQLLSDWA